MGNQIHPTAIIHPKAELADNVTVGPFCVIGEHVKIGAGTVLHSSVVIDGWTTVGENNVFWPGAVVGVAPQDLSYQGQRSYTKIGDGNSIREYVTIHSASDEGGVTSVGDKNLLMAYVHVAHNCQLGNQIVIANSVGIAGHSIIEDQAVLGGMSGFHQFVRIGRLAMVGGMSRVSVDIPPFSMVNGNPVRWIGLNSKGMERRDISRESTGTLKKCYQLLTSSGLNQSQALERIESEIEPTKESKQLVDFLRADSRMGVCLRKEQRRKKNLRKTRSVSART